MSRPFSLQEERKRNKSHHKLFCAKLGTEPRHDTDFSHFKLTILSSCAPMCNCSRKSENIHVETHERRSAEISKSMPDFPVEIRVF